MKKVRARIVLRTEPCRCGCKGRDPQHRAWVDREVRNIRWGDLTEARSPFSDVDCYLPRALLGEIKLNHRVVEVALPAARFKKTNQWATTFWEIAREV